MMPNAKQEFENAIRYRDHLEKQKQKYEKIFRRIGRFRKYAYDMSNLISSHAVKVASLRDKNDEVAKCLDDFKKTEEFSTTSKLSMSVAAEILATVGDEQDKAVQRVETLVLPNLASYARICDCIKADVWNAIQAIKREKRRKKSVKNLHKKSEDPKTKSCLKDAHRELERASAETARLCQLSEEQVLKFEHKRLIDLKESLGTFIKIQIAASAKSLELLSQMYKRIQNIDEDEDLEILKTCLKIGDHGSSSKKSLKQTKSHKSVNSGTGTSAKSSAGTLKGKGSKGTVENEDSKDSSYDSYDSEIGQDLENILHINSETSYKNSKKHSNNRLSCKESLSVDRTGKPVKLRNEEEREYRQKPRAAESSGFKKSREKDKLHNKQDQSISNNRYEAHDDSRTRKNYKHATLSDEDNYLSKQQAKLGKRPSTPPRPITSARRSSTEDISSRIEEFTYHNDKKRPVTVTGDAYYHSPSEDEKQRVYARGVPLRESRHVTFSNRSLSDKSHGQTGLRQGVVTKSAFRNELEMTFKRRDAGDLINNYQHKRSDLSINNSGTKQQFRSYC